MPTQETKKLHDESTKYAKAINGRFVLELGPHLLRRLAGMLTHQIEFSRAIAELYKPISGRVSDPDSFVSEGNDAGIHACGEYESVVRDLQETLAPELEMIEQRVIAPADEMMQVIKAVRKTTLKRQHKQLDYDRQRAALKKLQDKKDRSVKDEKALYKAEADAEAATQDFDYFNDLLKDELPKLFRLEREFIRPLFQSFYYMQLNVFYTLHERMSKLDIDYFDLTLDIEAAFAKKREGIQEEVEALSICRYKTTGGKRPPPGQGSKYAAMGEKASSLRQHRSAEPLESPPPPYSPSPDSHGVNGALSPPPEKSAAVGRANSTGSAFAPSSASIAAAAKAKGPAPPPPKPKPSRLSGQPALPTATALYDYEAQAEGDLSFAAGDIIEVTVKGATENEWWTGKLKGRTGQFPGKGFACIRGHRAFVWADDGRQLYQAELITKVHPDVWGCAGTSSHALFRSVISIFAYTNPTYERKSRFETINIMSHQ